MLSRTTLASYVVFALCVGGFLAAPVLTAGPPTSRAVGIITGVVRDVEGDPLGGARVELVGTARSTQTITDGRFMIDSVPTGRAEIRVSLPGYLPAQAEVRVAEDSVTALDVVLVVDGQPLPTVTVKAKTRGRILGTVVDSVGTPLPGVSVGLVGTRGTTMTDSIGRFEFLDLAPGQYLVEARRVGFELSRYPVRMTDNLERIVTMRLRRGPMALTLLELHNTEVAAKETYSRISMRSMTKSFVMSREQLAPFGRQPMDVVLSRSDFRQFMRGAIGDAGALDTMCVLVDGWRSYGRGYQPIDAGAGPGGTRAPSEPNKGGWLRSFYADEVEMVEVYVANTDYSGTLCSRFSHGSGCACGPPPGYLISPPTVVIWLKK